MNQAIKHNGKRLEWNTNSATATVCFDASIEPSSVVKPFDGIYGMT